MQVTSPEENDDALKSGLLRDDQWHRAAHEEWSLEGKPTFDAKVRENIWHAIQSEIGATPKSKSKFMAYSGALALAAMIILTTIVVLPPQEVSFRPKGVAKVAPLTVQFWQRNSDSWEEATESFASLKGMIYPKISVPNDGFLYVAWFDLATANKSGELLIDALPVSAGFNDFIPFENAYLNLEVGEKEKLCFSLQQGSGTPKNLEEFFANNGVCYENTAAE